MRANPCFGFLKITRNDDWESRTEFAERLSLVGEPKTEAELAYNASMRRLNDVLFSFQDYAVIACKPA